MKNETYLKLVADPKAQSPKTRHIHVIVLFWACIGVIGLCLLISNGLLWLDQQGFAHDMHDSSARLEFHGNVVFDRDGAYDFRAAGDSLCRAVRGRPTEPRSAETLIYYPGGYDNQNINPPPAGMESRTIPVPLAWASVAIYTCVQDTRTVYFLLQRAKGDVTFADYGDAWGWEYPAMAGSSVVLDEKRLDQAIHALRADVRRSFGEQVNLIRTADGTTSSEQFRRPAFLLEPAGQSTQDDGLLFWAPLVASERAFSSVRATYNIGDDVA